MPNHIKNILKFNCTPEKRAQIFEQIQNDEHGSGSIDFNKIIPMPESLNIDAGSMEKRLINLYLTASNPHTKDMGIQKLDVLSHPIAKAHVQTYARLSCNDMMTEEEIAQTVLHVKQFPENQKKTFSDLLDEEMAKGKQYVDNAINHHATTLYEWSIREWGTKWNSYDFGEAGDNEISFNTAWSRPEPVIKKLSEMFPEIKIMHSWADEDIGYNVGEIEYLGGEEISYDIPSPGSMEAYDMAADIQGIDLAEYGYQLKADGSGYEYVDSEESLGQTMDN